MYGQNNGRCCSDFLLRLSRILVRARRLRGIGSMDRMRETTDKQHEYVLHTVHRAFTHIVYPTTFIIPLVTLFPSTAVSSGPEDLVDLNLILLLPPTAASPIGLALFPNPSPATLTFSAAPFSPPLLPFLPIRNPSPSAPRLPLPALPFSGLSSPCPVPTALRHYHGLRHSVFSPSRSAFTTVLRIASLTCSSVGQGR